MRLTVFAAAVGSVVALVGFAGAANASATIDLIWASTGTDTIGDVTEVLTSSSIQLNVIVTAGPLGVSVAVLTVDFLDAAALGKVTVLGATNTPSTALPLAFGDPILGVSTITNLNGSAIPGAFGTGLVNAGDSEQIATITFHKSQLVIGTFEFRVNTATLGDDIIALDGLTNLSATSIFNSAFLINIPEPGGLALLGSGLAMLALLRRGRSGCRAPLVPFSRREVRP